MPHSHLRAQGVLSIMALLAACGQREEPTLPASTRAGSCITSVTASGDDGNVPANVIDGDPTTRWSEDGVGSWIRADHGVSVPTCGVRIAWYRGNQRRSHFAVAVSGDGAAWQTVHLGDSSGTTTALETYAFAEVDARYVRITVNGNTSNDWASITELETVACGGAAPVSATASGHDGNVPANAIDGDLDTRWSSLGKGSWIRADLGETTAIAGIDIAWYRGELRRSHFVVAVSQDGATWQTVHQGDSSGTTSALEHYGFASVDARWVRVTVNGNTSNDWASISELAVTGEAPTCGGDDGGDDDAGDDDEPPSTSDGGGGSCTSGPPTDQNGVAYIDLPGFTYEGGIERFDWRENFKSNGSMRHDFEGTPEENQCLVGYFVVDGPDDEEISAKLGGGPHTDDHETWADTHDLAIANFAGDRSRIRWEATHPEYDDGPVFDIDVGDLRNKWVGAMACKLNVDEDGDGTTDAIRYVAYIDPEGLDAQGVPANAWVQTMDATIPVDDVALKSPTVPYVVTIGESDQAQATMRIDEQDEDAYAYEHIAYRSPLPCTE